MMSLVGMELVYKIDYDIKHTANFNLFLFHTFFGYSQINVLRKMVRYGFYAYIYVGQPTK